MTARAETAAAEFYDPATNTWRATGSLNQARYYHATCLLPDGRVLTAGGQKSGANNFTSSELYDPATEKWTYTGDLLMSQILTDMVVLPNGKVLIAGGTANQPSAQLYDPTTGAWSATGSLNYPRGNCHLTLLHDGTVLVAGGQVSQGEIYHPDSGTWTLTGPMNIPRSAHVQVLLADGRVLVAGGETSQGSKVKILRSTEIFDPATGLWSQTAGMADARTEFTGNLLADGSVLVAGGSTLNFGILASIETYSPLTGIWSHASHGLKIERAAHTATNLLNGKLIVAGGANHSGEVGQAELISGR